MSTNLVRIFEEPISELPLTKLPRISDALKAIYFHQQVKDQTKEVAIKSVANQIKDLWRKTTIPAVAVQRIVQKLTELYETHHKLSYAVSTPATEEKKLSFKVKVFCFR